MAKQDKISYKTSADGRVLSVYVPTQPVIHVNLADLPENVKAKAIGVGIAERLNNTVAGRGPKGENWVSWQDCHSRLVRKATAFEAGQWELDAVPAGINWPDFQQAMVVILSQKGVPCPYGSEWTVAAVAQRMAGKPMAETLALFNRPEVQGEIARIAQERATAAAAQRKPEELEDVLAAF